MPAPVSEEEDGVDFCEVAFCDMIGEPASALLSSEGDNDGDADGIAKSGFSSCNTIDGPAPAFLSSEGDHDGDVDGLAEIPGDA